MTPFDPSAKAKKDYVQSGMKPADYNAQRLDWLKSMATSEGKEYKPGYVPKGYTKIQASPINTMREKGKPFGYTETWRYSSVEGKKPDALFWKPDAFAKYRPDLPAAKWDYTKDIQNYWHNPTNVVSWHEHFRVQDEGYEPPSWLNKDFVEEQYKALKDYNDYEDDPLYWKPLPIGHEAAYYSNFGADPNGNTPIYEQIAEQVSQPEAVTARYREYAAQAQQTVTGLEGKSQEEIQTLIDDVNTQPDAASGLAKLEGKVTPEFYNNFKAYLKAEKIIPYEEGEVAPGIDEPGGAGGSYSELYGWQKLTQTLGSTAEDSTRPQSSKTVADLMAALLPAIGIGSMTAGTAAAIAAVTTPMIAVGDVAAAATAATVAGIPIAIAIKIVAGLVTIGTAAYLYSQKDNPNNTAVQKIFAPFQVGAEHTERAIGAVNVATTLAKEDKPIDIRAAYDAGFVTNELHAPSGTADFLFDAASVVGEWIDKLGMAFGQDWDISGGETTQGNEVWMLDKGYKEPVEAEIPLGKEGMLVAYDAMKALGDDRTRNEMMVQWAYLTSLTGSSGTFNDYIVQNILDPLNFAPNLENAALGKYATLEAKKYAELGDAYRATAFTTLAQAAKGAQGNILLDALPMGAQQVGKAFAQRFETVAAWAYSNKVLGDKVSLKDFSKSYTPSIRDSMGIGDTLNIYNARMEMGYNNLAKREFVMRIGGKLENTVRLLPFTDGSLKILNVDGTKSWDYTKENLAKIGVTFVNDADGNLTITGVTKLMTDAGIKGRVSSDVVNTRINIQPTTEDFDSIDPTDADYQTNTDPAVFVVKKDSKTYTVDATSGRVQSAVDADGNPVTFAKTTLWGERPVIIGNEVYSPGLAAVMGDYITLANKSYVIATNKDYRSNADIKAEGLRGKLTGLNSGLVNKAIDWYTSLSELTPGNKALLEAENLREGILFLHMFSGNNFEMTMRAIKKMVGGADVGDIAKAAEQFINQSGTVASVAGAMKVAFGDGSQADMFVQIYKDTLPKRAYIDKVSKAIGVDPHKLLEMSGQAILDKLKNKLAPKTDATSLTLMEQIASGVVNAKTIEDTLAPFKGKSALPLTDADFLATVTIYADKAIQDYLIEKYNIKKLDVWTRVSSMKKALLSPLLIGMPYTTWMNNLWSNLGAQFFLLGEAPFTGNTAMNEFVKSLGMEALPFAPADRFGLASDVIDATSRISLLLNPNDNIGKVTRTLRNFGGAFKAYSKIEQYNTSALFLVEVLNMHRRIDLPGMPENIKTRLTTAGVTPDQQKYIQKMLNRTKSVAEMEKIFTSGIEYDAVNIGLIEAAADALSQNNPDRANVYKELMQKVANDEDFMATAGKVTDPKDVYRIREALDTSLEKQINVMLDESVRTWKFEVENIMSKEGMAGGINLMASAIFGELSHRITNSLSWGEAMQAASRAMAVGDYAQRTRIIRNRRTQAKESFKRFFAMQDMQFKTMADVLQAGDANGKAFADIIAKRHGESSEIMAAIEKNYEDYFDRVANNKEGKWDDIVANNEALMARLDKMEIVNLKALAKLWTDMLGSKVASNVAASGISATDLKRGGAKMMKKLIDGYTELNKLRTQHYADIKDLGGADKRAAQMTFWNEVWQPKVGTLINAFSEDNWNTFFKVQTDFAKATYPETPEPEAAPAPKTKASPGEQAAQNVSNKVNKRRLDESAKANVDAVHAAAGAEHTTLLWHQQLERAVGMTPEQRTWADIFVGTLDETYSARTGKPTGSWLTEIGTVAVKAVDQTTLRPDINSKLEVAAMTTWDANAKRFDILVSKTHNATTFLQEADRIIFNTPLIEDADKAIITMEYGGIGLDKYNEILARVNSKTATPEDTSTWRTINDDFANAHKLWLFQDAATAAPSAMLRKVFVNISNAVRTLVKHIQGKYPDFKVSDEVRGVFNRLHFVNDTAELKTRNAARMKVAPTGKSVTLLGTIDAKKTYEATAKLVEIDDLIGSNVVNPDNQTVGINPLYDTERQWRIRDNVPNANDVIARSTPGTFEPLKLLLDTRGLEVGPIIVDENGMVISGNGRLLTLLFAKQNHPDSWEAYQSAMTKMSADTWGFTDADAKALTNGVLVLEVDSSKYNLEDMVVDANKPSPSLMTAYETSLANTQYLPDGIIQNLEISDALSFEKTLTMKNNRGLIDRFIDKVPDRNLFIGQDGQLTPDGIRAIKYSMFAKVFDSDAGNKLLMSFVENTDSSIKVLESGIMNALPQLAKLDALIKQGMIPAELLPTDLIARATRKMSDLRNSGTSLETYLAQTSLFADIDENVIDKKFIKFIYEHSRSSKAITKLLTEYADNAMKQTTQEGLFGEAVKFDSAEETFGKTLDLVSGEFMKDAPDIETLGDIAKALTSTPVSTWDYTVMRLMSAKLRQMTGDIASKPIVPPEWFNTAGIVDKGYSAVSKTIDSMLGADDKFNPLRTQVIAQAWDSLMKESAEFRRAVNAQNTPEGLDAEAKGLAQGISDLEKNAPDGLFQKAEDVQQMKIPDEGDQQDIFGNFVTPEQRLGALSAFDKILAEKAQEALELRKRADLNAPVHVQKQIDNTLVKIDQLFIPLDEEMVKVNKLIEKAEGLFQQADEVVPTVPITEYPVGSSPVHLNTGAALNELYELNVPLMRDQMMDTLSQRMTASERPTFKINLNEEGQAAMKDYLNIAKENQRLRMSAILDAAKRVTKDVMIDYSRRHGFDQAVEMVFPYQFWYTRSTMMWLKRMVAKPAIAAAAFRYHELQRRNEMKGFPSRMGGKTPIYTPWLSEGMGDYMSMDVYGRFFTPAQLFQPVANYARLDAETTTETQRYIYELVKQKVVSADDAKKAITTMSGTIWEDALQYIKLNSMADKTDPFTMASMAINPDPFINIMYQSMRGTPEKISPLPLTRIGNSFESIGGDTVLGIIGTMLSFPEDTIRKAAGIPQAGEYGDYYVDFWLANMATYDKAPIEDIKNAMISREGAVYEEAYKLAQQYIGLRTPGTPFFKAIKDGHRDPETLASAFLMSFMPTGLYPDGEMALRGLQDDYAAAWEDYERGDKEALEKFETAHPEYALRRMMFQEPTERLRGHLINIIWDKYTQLPSANRAIAADTLGEAFKAYFLDAKTQNYNAVDEGTLTTWAKQLGGMVPSTPETEQQAEQTVAPMKYYPEDRAAVIQAFSDERKVKFPDYWLYQGVYYNLTKDQQKQFLTKVPMLQRYWDWKKAQGETNPTLKSYFDDLSNASKSGSYDTEYDAQAAADYMSAFDEKLLSDVITHQATGDPLSSGAKAELNTLFQLAGKPGGDFNLWLKVLLGE